VISSFLEVAAIEARASPRKPRVVVVRRSSKRLIFDVVPFSAALSKSRPKENSIGSREEEWQQHSEVDHEEPFRSRRRAR